jgi:hypothetical protein
MVINWAICDGCAWIGKVKSGRVVHVRDEAATVRVWRLRDLPCPRCGDGRLTRLSRDARLKLFGTDSPATVPFEGSRYAERRRLN